MKIYLNNLPFEQRHEERDGSVLGVTPDENIPSKGNCKPLDARTYLASERISKEACLHMVEQGGKRLLGDPTRRVARHQTRSIL